MTDIGRSISNSDATKKLHEIGASAQENPGDALAVGLTGGVFIAALPFTAPVLITKETAFGATLNVASYIGTTDASERTLSGYAYSIGTGVGTSIAVGYLSKSDSIIIKSVIGFGAGAGNETINQLEHNGGDYSKLNIDKIIYTGTTTAVSTVIGSKVIIPASGTTGYIIIDRLQKENEKKDDK